MILCFQTTNLSKTFLLFKCELHYPDINQIVRTLCNNLGSDKVMPGGGGVLPYMGYIGMCGPKGYGFSAFLVRNRVSILADFGHFGHK